MFLPMLISVLATLSFGTLAAYFSHKEGKLRQKLTIQEHQYKQRLYETAILKEIQDRVGYSLDIEKIIDVITGSLKNLFPYSTASSLLLKEDKVVLKIYVEQEVSSHFVASIKQTMLASLAALTDTKLPERVEESITGTLVNPLTTLPVASFFNIPLIVNEKVVGIINISSTQPGLYKEQEMTVLYQITNQASLALSRLHDVLTREKSKLLAMIRSLTDGLFMVDQHKQLSVINQTAIVMLGITKPDPGIIDVISRLPTQYDFATKIEQSMNSDTAIEEKEVQLGEKFVHVSITPVHGLIPSSNPKETVPSAIVIGASVLLQDITLEKSLSQMKEDFTNMVVHELRAPLTAIHGAAKLMINPLHSIPPDEGKRLLDIISEQSQRLLVEVSSLLDAAKLESGRFVLQKSPTDLFNIIDTRVAFFVPEAQKRNIQLTLIKPPFTIKPLDIDPFRMEQVFNNLISNSVKFTPAGGRISITVSHKDNYLTVAVSDTGAGIPKEKQAQIFSKFYQVVSSNPVYAKLHALTTSQAPQTHAENLGTGLGLFITKGIVEAHGGAISLQSEEGHGTTISFTLPVTQTQLIPLAQNTPQTTTTLPLSTLGTAIN